MESKSFTDYLKEMEGLMNQAEQNMDLETLRCFLQATDQKVARLKWLWFE